MSLLDSLGTRALGAFPVFALFADPACLPERRPEVQEETGGPSPLAKAEAEVANAMGDHFTLAKRIEEELVEGRLNGARDAASALAASSPSSYPADWMPWVLELRNAAQGAAHTRDVGSSARALGEIVAACGACHGGLGQGPTFAQASEPPPNAPAIQVHGWAAERMWEGIVGPSDVSWRGGTTRFPTLPECARENRMTVAERTAVQAAREQVSELTAVAATVTDARARAVLYGEYVATCAACHRSGC